MQANNNTAVVKLYGGQAFSRGFTLIEILIVMVIIGISLSMALLAFGDFGEKRRIISAAEKFSEVLTLIKQEAILKSNTLTIRFNKTGYEVLRFEAPTTWHRIDKGPLRPHRFPTSMQIQFKNKKNQSKSSSIFIDNSGNISPFELNFGTTEQPDIAIVIGHSNGKISIEKTRSP